MSKCPANGVLFVVTSLLKDMVPNRALKDSVTVHSMLRYAIFVISIDPIS